MMTSYKKLFLSGLILFSLSCKEDKPIIDQRVSKLVEEYIQQNPLQLPIKKNLYQNGFSYPSYHVYFERKNTDTLLRIVQLPHLTDVKLDGYEPADEKGVYIYDYIETKGFFLYQEKFPVIILDEDSIGRKFYDIKKLSPVPDSLKPNTENYDPKIIIWDYLFKKGAFKKRAP